MPPRNRTMIRLFVVLAIVCVASGCAPNRALIKPDFMPNEREGLVYGQMEFVVDGQGFSPEARTAFTRPTIYSYVSRYVEGGPLSTSGWDSSDFRFEASVSRAGHFAARLPVGKYYFMTFEYFSAVPGPLGHASLRTYTEIEESGVKLTRPMLLTFEVLPNKATYIGNVHHFLQFGMSGAKFTTGFDLQFSNQYAPETNWLLQQYPQLIGATESHVLRRDYLSAPVR